MPTLDDAIESIRMGDKEAGRDILEGLLDLDENDEMIWLWLSTVVEASEDREICLENVLALDPNNGVAQQGLENLQAGYFDPDEMIRELIDENEIEEIEAEPTTFIDDFVVSDDDLDDDFAFPGKSNGAKKKKLDGRQKVILGVLVVVLVGVLGALGVSAMFFMGGGGDDASPGNQATQEAPAGQSQPDATATETPLPTPTHTPTQTPTSTPDLGLPTPKPTDLPTPTATRVVSPTPAN